MIFFQIVQVLACLYVLGSGLGALNRMSKSTRLTVRCAYVAMVFGSAAGIVSCIVYRDIFECIFAVGVALYMAFSQRRCTDELQSEH
jgi:hypothetical protein